MSLVVVALIAGSSAAAGLALRWALSRRGAASETSPVPAAASQEEPKREKSVLAVAGFDIDVGDVVDIGGQSLWLEHGWMMCEGDEPVAAVLVANEATLLLVPPPAKTVFLLDPVELSVGAEPPTSIESRDVRFERARRIPVRIQPLLDSAPLPWDEAVLAEYRAMAGDALWVLARGGRAKAWQGRVLQESEIDRFGGGQQTLK